jgi:molybdate transport system substrate-binding protein
MRRRTWLGALWLGVLWCTAGLAADAQPTLLVFGAASLTNVLDELGPSYTQATGQPVKFSYAASSALVRQLESGAGADVFLSADEDWMNYVQERSLIRTDSRINLLGNRLVLVAPADSTSTLKIAAKFGLRAALGDGRLALADPDSVPAGKYARAALTSLGVWDEVAGHLVLGDSVRTALAFVDRGECPFGIVYETDALIDRKVRVVDNFPDSSHAPIVYPVAVTLKAQAGAEKLVEFLRGPVGRAAFVKYGFTMAAAR